MAWGLPLPLLRFWLASALDFCNTSSLPGEVCCSCGALRLALPVGPFFFSFFFFPSFLKGWHCDLPLSQSCGISALRCRAVTPPLHPLSQVSFCRADASQFGASPLGSRLSPIMRLPWNPIQQFLLCFNRRVPSFPLLGSCWVRSCVPRPLR